MSKRQTIALLIICICAIIMIMTTIKGSKTDVNFVFYSVKALSSLVFLGFTVTGVIIGILIK